MEGTACGDGVDLTIGWGVGLVGGLRVGVLVGDLGVTFLVGALVNV